jgi:hypothetical protein
MFGADVFAARQHEARDAVERRGGQRCLDRRKDERNEANRGEGAGVRLVDSNSLPPA